MMLLVWILLMHGAVSEDFETQKYNFKCERDISLDKIEPKFCSPWVYCDNGECKCGEIPHGILQCSVHTNLSVLDFECVTYNEAKGLFEAGSCIYLQKNAHVHKGEYNVLPKDVSSLNNETCYEDMNRDGTLCGKCKDGYYPLAYSFDTNCVQCPNGGSNWWKLVLAAFLPLTIFYFLVLFLKLNITSSAHFRGFIFFCQVISLPIVMRILLLTIKNNCYNHLQSAARYIYILYGMWSLDFFRSLELEICLNISSLQILALDLAVAVYPLMLMIITYLLIQLHDRNFKPLVLIWKPFSKVFGLIRNHWDIKTSVVDGFSAFFLLSNLKFFTASFDMLTPVKVYQLDSMGHLTYTWRLYYDATIPYFGPRHVPYALVTIVVLLLFFILPNLLLILYPFRWFQKMLNIIPVRWYVLHTFVDSFQGCYKDGTEAGTRDCRLFSSVLFVTPCLLMAIGWLTITAMFYPLAAMLLVLVAILFITVEPFKEPFHHYTYTTAMFLLVLALWYVSLIAGAIAEVKAFQMFIPSLVMAIVVSLLPPFYVYGKLIFRIIRRLHIWRQGYTAI